MNVWIARDGDDDLYFYETEPAINEYGNYRSYSGRYMILSRYLFPDIKAGECKKYELKEVK